MTPALRLALWCLRAVPLVKWIAASGAALIALAFLARPGMIGALVGLGSMLTIFPVAMLVGPGLRAVSVGSTLRLRPGAHRKLLAALYLVVAMMTLVVVVPQWLIYNLHLLPSEGRAGNFLHLTTSLEFALGTWSVLSLMAIVFFTVPGAPGMTFGAGMLLMLGASFAGDALDRVSLPFFILPLVAMLAWCIFAAWYLRGPRLVSLTQRMMQGTGTTLKPNLLIRALQADDGAANRAAAVRAYLLGATSLKMTAFAGLFGLIPMLPFIVIQMRGHTGPPWFDPPLAFFGLFCAIGVSQAISATRRARSLWLRAGLDRAALFGLVEVEVLMAAGLALAILAVALGGLSVWSHHELLTGTLAYVLAMAAFSLTGLYYGLSLVERMSAVDYVLGLLLFVAWLLLTARLLPTFDQSVKLCSAAIGISTVAVIALRSRALHRWQRLDWRILRPLVRTNLTRN